MPTVGFEEMITRTRTKWKPKGIVFAVAEQSREWADVEAHLRLLPSILNVKPDSVTDGRFEGIEFRHGELDFALFNSLLWEPDKKAEIWFYVCENAPPEEALQSIVEHFSPFLD
jgi:hypothetical protein